MSAFRNLGAGLAAAVISLAALAAPFASAPSAVQVGQSVTLLGGGFEPGSVITVRVTAPGNGVSMSAVVAAQDGSISHPLVAAAEGAHIVQLIDAAGATLVGELKFVASP